MKPPAFIFASDWHLAHGAWRNLPAYGDAYFALRQVVDMALHHDVDIVAPGDLFDVQRPDARSLHQAFTAGTRMQGAGRAIYFTRGQHDQWVHELDDIPYPLLAEGYRYLHGRLQEIGGLAVFGLDHCAPQRLRAALAELPAHATVLACHQLWSEWARLMADASLTEVPAQIRLVVSGDYHVHAATEFREGCWGLSCGSLCMQNIREESEKECYLVYRDGSFADLPLRSRRVVRVAITDAAAAQRLLEEDLPGLLVPTADVPVELQQNLLYFRLAAPGLLDLEELRRRVAGQALLILQTSGTNVEAAPLVPLPGTTDYLEQVAAQIPNMTPHLLPRVLQLARSQTPEALLDEMEREFLGGTEESS